MNEQDKELPDPDVLETESASLSIPTDETFASDIQDFHELLRTQDLEGLLSALESPDLFRLACDDERYLGIAMQGIAVLAWDEPARASELLVRFDINRLRELPHSEARQAARALMAALEWRQLEAKSVVPVTKIDALRNFLRLFPALAGDKEHRAMLQDDMHDRPDFYVDLCQKLTTQAQVLPDWISRLEGRIVSSQESAGNASSEEVATLEELSETQLSALSSAVTELRTSLRARASRYIVWTLVLALVVALPNAAGVLLALLVIGASFALGENKSYDQIVRPRLVTLAIEHGVGARAVVSLLYRLSGKAGKVGHFDIKIENDRALDLLAALSRSSSPPAAS